MVRFAVLGVLLALLLTGCRSVPISTDFDLLERTSLEPDGSVQVTIEEGDVEPFEQRRPNDGKGDCVPLGGEGWRPKVHEAFLKYDVAVRYEGPELEGHVAGQAHVAASKDELWETASRLGPKLEADLSRTSKRFTGTMELGPRQVEALRERRACWGAVVEGSGIRANGSGEARLTYDVERLVLTARFGVF